MTPPGHNHTNIEPQCCCCCRCHRRSNMSDLLRVGLLGLLLSVCPVLSAQPPPKLAPAQPAWPQAVTLYPDHLDDQTLIPPVTTTTTTAKPTTTAYPWPRDQYPSPQTQFVECRQPEASLLCDPDGLLSAEDAKQVRAHQEALSTSTSQCFCPECPPGDVGLKVGVALVKTIFRRYNHNQEEQDFANFLRRQWHLGSCNNSLLLLYIAADNQVSISSGSVAAEVVPESILEDTIRTAFGKHDVRLVDELSSVLRQINSTMHMSHRRAPAQRPGGEPQELAPATTTALVVIGVMIGFLLVVSLIVSSIILMKKRYESQADPQEPGPQGEAGDDEDEETEEARKPQGYWNDPEVRKRESIRRAPGTDYVPVSIDEDEANAGRRTGKKSVDNSHTDDETG